MVERIAHENTNDAHPECSRVRCTRCFPRHKRRGYGKRAIVGNGSPSVARERVTYKADLNAACGAHPLHHHCRLQIAG